MSHNRNPNGRNQFAPVPPASDPVLQEALIRYHRECLTNNRTISARLLADYGISAKPCTIKRRRAELNLFGSYVTTREIPFHQKVQLIIDELENDPSSGRGLDNIRRRIAFKHGIHLTRDFVSDIMHIQNSLGFELREPSSKRVVRVKKAPIGIHERWSGDGHDKLNSIGFPIWAVVDDATAKWLGGWVVPSNRLGIIIAYLYLTLIERYGGMPIQFTTDCGSETTQAFGFGNALRRVFQPHLDPDELPAHIYLRSVHNISIERSWLRLRLEWGNNAVLVFKKGIEDGVYNPDNTHQRTLCQWLWPKLLQQELDLFMEFRNGVRMRKDNTKAGPSGMSRNEAFSLYENWGGINCLQEVDVDVIRSLKAKLGGDELLSFVSIDFAEQAESAYQTLGLTHLSFGTVWTVFEKLMPILFP